MIDLNIGGGIAHLVLNRPEKLNALGAAMVRALGQPWVLILGQA